ncbi:MAG: hypothetical protein HY000_02125 [Planctomycetes bacterium]|nr:hypothetical protein [Planctomycetota bacterium]
MKWRNNCAGCTRLYQNGSVYLGDGLIEVDGEPYRLEPAQEMVIEALVELRAATKEQLIERSGVEDAVNVLKAICQAIPQLSTHITLPGGRGKGGYRTTIRPKN